MKRFASLAGAGGTAAVVGALALAGGVSAAGSQLPTIHLGLAGKSVHVSGKKVSGAVNITTSVSGKKMGAPTLIRLKPVVTYEQALAAVGRHHGDPNYLRPYGAIAFDIEVARGVKTAQTKLAPGHYIAVDTEGNNPAKWPHTEFDIARSRHPAALPKAPASIRAIDFAYRGAVTLHPKEFVRFTNDGFVVHMTMYIKARNQGGAKKIAALLKAGKDGKAQRLATGFGTFMGAVSPGAVQQYNVRVGTGWYVLACFMDTQDGREHTQLGMERVIHVAK